MGKRGGSQISGNPHKKQKPVARPKIGAPKESIQNSTQQMALQAEYFAENGYPTLAQRLNPTIPEPPPFEISLESLIDDQGWQAINNRLNAQQPLKRPQRRHTKFSVTVE